MPPDLCDVSAKGEWARLGVEESQERTAYITLAQHKQMQKDVIFLGCKVHSLERNKLLLEDFSALVEGLGFQGREKKLK